MTTKKMGRNPFEAKAKPEANAKADAAPASPAKLKPKRKPAGRTTASSGASAVKSQRSIFGLYSRLQDTQALVNRALKTRLDRLSFVRYEKSSQGARVTLLAVGVLNPTIKSPKHIQVNLFQRPSMSIDLFSMKVQSA